MESLPRVDDRLLRFQEQLELAPGAEPRILLLKAHLLVEEQLQTYIDSRINDPSALRDARLSFSQRLCLAKALHPKPDRFECGWIWSSLRMLNKIRNSLVHTVEPSDFENQLKNLREEVLAHVSQPITPGDGVEYNMARLGFALSVMNAFLCKLLFVDDSGR